MMSIAVTVLFVISALIIGVSVTAAMFCMRERNSEHAMYNKLYQKWSDDNDYIIDLERENAEKSADIKHLKEKYEAFVPTAPVEVEAPSPEVLL